MKLSTTLAVVMVVLLATAIAKPKKSCPPGKYYKTSKVSCVRCPVKYYSRRGATRCTKCPRGTRSTFPAGRNCRITNIRDGKHLLNPIKNQELGC